jgi:xeroderma pigmentosum group C-complementing protein
VSLPTTHKPKPDINGNGDDEEEEDETGIEFENVKLPAPTIQTMLRESDDEDDDDDMHFEDVLIDPGGPVSAVPAGGQDGELNLNLSAQKAAMTTLRKTVERRKAITREEKDRRADTHKMHLLCLLSHVERRNRWCNDVDVQDTLRPLLTEKMLRALNPRSSLDQFARTDSLKRGLQEASAMFKAKYKITERGMRRALWPESEDDLKDVSVPG